MPMISAALTPALPLQLNLRLTGRLCASLNNASVRWHYDEGRGEGCGGVGGWEGSSSACVCYMRMPPRPSQMPHIPHIPCPEPPSPCPWSLTVAHAYARSHMLTTAPQHRRLCCVAHSAAPPHPLTTHTAQAGRCPCWRHWTCRTSPPSGPRRCCRWAPRWAEAGWKLGGSWAPARCSQSCGLLSVRAGGVDSGPGTPPRVGRLPTMTAGL